MTKLKRSKGFTLIELMIVVAIIGILAAVAIPKFADLVTKSKEAAVKGALGAVRSAVSIYYGDMEGSYPNNLFNGLTTANKYLPSQSGLGNFTTPKTAAGKPEHSFAVTGVTDVNETATLTDGTADALWYDTASGAGEVYVNCTHKDTKGNQWTAY